VAESLISLFQSRGPSYVSTREIIKHDHQDRELRYSIAMHPIRKGDCCGGSWTKWGAPFPCGLLATLKTFAQTTQITTQTILPAFNFLEIQLPFKPKTTTKQRVL